jgi:hypothetical protein
LGFYTFACYILYLRLVRYFSRAQLIIISHVLQNAMRHSKIIYLGMEGNGGEVNEGRKREGREGEGR